MHVRLQKFLAEAGLASRRASEQIILDGRVSINGQTVRRLGTRVDPDHDEVTVAGWPVRTRRKPWVALHKPLGCVCSRQDERGHPTIYDLLPRQWQDLYSVCLLYFNAEGLIFLTNDGQFALRLTHSALRRPKKYVVIVAGGVNEAILARLTRGIFHGGEKLRAQVARLMVVSSAKAWWNWNWPRAKTVKFGGCLYRRN